MTHCFFETYSAKSSVKQNHQFYIRGMTHDIWPKCRRVVQPGVLLPVPNYPKWSHLEQILPTTVGVYRCMSERLQQMHALQFSLCLQLIYDPHWFADRTLPTNKSNTLRKQWHHAQPTSSPKEVWWALCGDAQMCLMPLFLQYESNAARNSLPINILKPLLNILHAPTFVCEHFRTMPLVFVF